MQLLYLPLIVYAVLVVAYGEPQTGKHSLYHYSPPSKGIKQLALNRHPNNKQKTLVVQIRSDQPVPLMFKARPTTSHIHGHGHKHVHHHINAASNNHNHVRAHPRPLKLSAPVYLHSSSTLRKPIKLKLTNSKAKPFNSKKPASSNDAPFKYEKPDPYANSEIVQHLPLKSYNNFMTEHFGPIHTIPAPNLALQEDNHLHLDDTYFPSSSPKPQVYHHKSTYNYKVVEEDTNDQTLVDPHSGFQKLFAPDPDPSLAAVQVRPATEPFSRPSNGKPLPSDVQSNLLPVAQPLVQIVGAQAAKHIIPEIYPIQFSQTAQLQRVLNDNVAGVQAVPIPIYNPTYLVTQSNNLFNQHQQQLFKPAVNDEAPVVQTGFVNADLTQEVASDGQILQAAKDVYSNIHPILDITPHFAPLIAAPSLGEETVPLHVENVIVPTETTKTGFVVSNFYGNGHQDSTQLFQDYIEEEQAESHRQQYENIQQQLLQEQRQQYVPYAEHLRQNSLEVATVAFEEHERLVKQQLGADTPLRIFVPDDEESRLHKRSDESFKGSTEGDEKTNIPADDKRYEEANIAEDPNKNSAEKVSQMQVH